jgi:hypothetical protein
MGEGTEGGITSIKIFPLGRKFVMSAKAVIQIIKKSPRSRTARVQV